MVLTFRNPQFMTAFVIEVDVIEIGNGVIHYSVRSSYECLRAEEMSGHLLFSCPLSVLRIPFAARSQRTETLHR
jgi:hypothetical protein